ncbi:hypothetical protein RHMOL_Rhmol07G0215700 [Rhododendron molle]|uniref:Uncharacterized protein n=1 Tax=Rhododendron molle TaxID=49168 RepID=A0ACC0N4D7_RHOML|nr:hypothetical protein RHMOL_Rhmol07G0215700 [Rhododendron molle]
MWKRLFPKGRVEFRPDQASKLGPLQGTLGRPLPLKRNSLKPLSRPHDPFSGDSQPVFKARDLGSLRSAYIQEDRGAGVIMQAQNLFSITALCLQVQLLKTFLGLPCQEYSISYLSFGAAPLSFNSLISYSI